MTRDRPLWVKHLGFRLPATLMLGLTATLTAGAAALGPLYSRAAAESVLHDTLVAAPPLATGLRLRASRGVDGQSIEPGEYAGWSAGAPSLNQLYGYSQRIGEQVSPTVSMNAKNVSPVHTQLVWRQNACAHLVLTAGRCPSRAGEVLVAQRTVAWRPYGWRMGGVLSQSLGEPLTVVGTYRPRSTGEPFWFGTDYFLTGSSPDGPDLADSVFVAPAEFDILTRSTRVRASVDYLLDPDRVRLADVQRVRMQAIAIPRRFSVRNGSGITASTDLAAVLDRSADQGRLVAVGTLLVTAQSVLLGWLVFFLVAADAIEARGGEIALAKLRGLRPAATVLFALGEPLGLLAAAVPAGVLLGIAATAAFAARVLAPGTPVLLDAGTVLAPIGAFIGGAVAAALAARRVLTRPVLEQWRRTAHSTARGRPISVLGVLAAVLAGAGFVAFQVLPSSDRPDGLVLIAPGLLVLAVALLGIGLFPLVLRPALATTRGSRRLGAFLAVRQVTRRPAGLRLATLMAVAVGLASFGVAAEGVAAGNRTARAEAEVGAPTAMSVQVQTGVDPVRAVRLADPAGDWAMAAATWLPDGGETVTGTVLALDASRLASIAASARGGTDSATLARLLRSAVPPVLLKADRIRATVTGTVARGRAPTVRFDLLTMAGRRIEAPAGALLPGRHVYTTSIPCDGGCEFVGLTWDRPVTLDGPMNGTALISAITVGTAERPLPLHLATARSWRQGEAFSGAADRVSIGPEGITDRFSSTSGYGGVRVASVPDPLPAVATPAGLVSGRAGGGEMTDTTESTARFLVRRSTPVLPAVLDDGVLVDAAAIESDLPGFAGEATWQVWASHRAPADAAARLARVGLIVDSSTNVSARTALLARQGPALSLLLLLVSAGVSTLLAAAVTATAISASARRRSYEAAALEAIGVRRRQLFGAALAEQLLLLGSAVVLGVPAGSVAALLTLPSVPEFATFTPVELRYVPSVLPLVAAALAFGVLVIVAAALAALAVIRSARAGRLREDDA